MPIPIILSLRKTFLIILSGKRHQHQCPTVNNPTLSFTNYSAFSATFCSQKILREASRCVLGEGRVKEKEAKQGVETRTTSWKQMDNQSSLVGNYHCDPQTSLGLSPRYQHLPHQAQKGIPMCSQVSPEPWAPGKHLWRSPCNLGPQDSQI